LDHPIQGLMKTAMESLQSMVDVNTVVGDPVEAPDGTVVIPVSRVSLGFVAGGGEYPGETRGREQAGWPFGGGSGAGISVTPVGFLVVGKESIRLLPMFERTALERILEAAPDFIERLESAWRRHRGDGSPGGSSHYRGEPASGFDYSD